MKFRLEHTIIIISILCFLCGIYQLYKLKTKSYPRGSGGLHEAQDFLIMASFCCFAFASFVTFMIVSLQ